MAETTCSHLQLQFVAAVLNSQAPSLPGTFSGNVQVFHAIRVGKEPLFMCIAESAVMKPQRGFYQPDTDCCLQPGTRSGGSPLEESP